VVLLHGFGTDSFLWRNLGPALAQSRFTAYAIDLFGYGQSDRPFDADFGIAAQVGYLERALTALRTGRVALVGVDIGGGVALRLAATRPERVSHLVLINTVAFHKLPGEDIRTLQRNTARLALRVSRGLFGAAPLLAPLLEAYVTDPERMPPKLVARYLAGYVGTDGVTHLLALARSLREEELRDIDVTAIQARTLVIWGEKERWLDPDIPDRLETAISGCRVVRIPNAGRLVPEDAPQELQRLIADFVTGGPADRVSGATPEASSATATDARAT
jgi:pimeloyl-ACP methyl ester carboxylesterase